MEIYLLIASDDKINVAHENLKQMNITEEILPYTNIMSYNSFEEKNKSGIIIFLNFNEKIEKLQRIAARNRGYSGININIVGNINVEKSKLVDVQCGIEDLRERLSSLKGQKKLIPEDIPVVISRRKKGLKIGIYANKGGSGKTQTALMAAEAKHLFLQEKCTSCIVDTNITEGSLGYMFKETNMTDTYERILQAYNNKENMEEAIISCVVHEPTFVNDKSGEYRLKGDFFAPPRNKFLTPQKIFKNKELIRSFVNSFGELYDITLFDMSNEHSTPMNEILFEECDTIFLVASPNTQGAKQLRDFMDKAKIDKNNVKLILNTWRQSATSFSPGETIAHIMNISQKSDEFKGFINKNAIIIPRIDAVEKINNDRDGVFAPYNIKRYTEEERSSIYAAMARFYGMLCPNYLKQESVELIKKYDKNFVLSNEEMNETPKDQEKKKSLLARIFNGGGK